MPRYRVKLNFTSPFYVGTRNKQLTAPDRIIHSDTLFSAIVNTYSLIYGLRETEEFVNRIIQEGVFLCSSAFPVIGDTYFVPKPISYKLGFDDPKNEKKVQFVDIEMLISKNSLTKEQVEEKNRILSKSIKIVEKPRVSIDRITNSANIYYSADVELEKNVAYWFFLEVNEEYEKKLKTVVNVLGDEGIGGEKTYGYGQFMAEFFEDNQDYFGNFFLLLSVFKPSTDEVKCLEPNGYRIARRGGYAYSPYQDSSTEIRYQMYNVFTEGSVFKSLVKGEIVQSVFNKVHKMYKNYRAYLIRFEM
ncbi:MAG: type III-A CRISPR-associated RAMP protein Csm4 [Fervidobacterium sp.]|nr:type III-A CRISPR-associated RAMP protein Csm4 [Fervidobacterium sp.]